MTMNEQELKNALRDLARATPQEPPAGLEQKLLQTFRRKRRSRRLAVWVVGGGVAAAIAAGLASVFLLPPPLPSPQARLIAPAPPVIAEPPRVSRGRAPAAVATHRPQRHRTSPPPSDMQEIATKFYALPDADMFAPVEDATVVRVQLPRSAMRLVGLPVNEERATERIRADIVLGQDGIARAVRFIQ